ncbi:unnamed protein product [Prorocentrum cordatum]|uniref:Uncharacterized protein n=1 Tax=Prorocentrum cordatum TaxID=2364126 RepID=A0ABN9PMH4_9DINO|nr:unnamed protein product [Polarella glacialis]|mmetsp:Transcript_97175/g.261034  ORF Transcript_97175/g.261034 Transcript_97175/m.261034 type:complete len:119 (-) Transcript_97175:160-516(-)
MPQQHNSFISLFTSTRDCLFNKFCSKALSLQFWCNTNGAEGSNETRLVPFHRSSAASKVRNHFAFNNSHQLKISNDIGMFSKLSYCYMLFTSWLIQIPKRLSDKCINCFSVSWFLSSD